MRNQNKRLCVEKTKDKIMNLYFYVHDIFMYERIGIF